jgi:hypothetical protein
LGEPILSGGLWGSQNALMADPDFSKNLKAVAFDRKQMGSVVTRQKQEFAVLLNFQEAQF